MEVEIQIGMSAAQFVAEFKPAVAAVEEAIGRHVHEHEPLDGILALDVYGEPDGQGEPQVTKLTFSNDDMERAEVARKVLFGWSEL